MPNVDLVLSSLVGKKVFAEFFVLEGSDGVGWVKCRKTTYVKDGKIKCVTPSGIGTHNEVRVTIGGQTSDVTGSYDYGGPVILSANLAEGSPAGAYWLILEGENFGTSKKTFDEAHTFVTVQGTKARGIKYKDNEHVEILMPAGVGSYVPIVMEKVANGGSNSLPSTKTARLKPFKFFRPKIHTISPTHLPSIGGVIKIDLAAQDSILQADLVHITNIVNNLLDNAIKYCDKVPNILVSTQNHKGKVVVNFKDNGKGISRDNLKYIFDKFYRVPTGNLHDVKGFGLGLFYVKTILEELNGSIQVKSVLGKGSEFIITLPINKSNSRK